MNHTQPPQPPNRHGITELLTLVGTVRRWPSMLPYRRRRRWAESGTRTTTTTSEGVCRNGPLSHRQRPPAPEVPGGRSVRLSEAWDRWRGRCDGGRQPSPTAISAK